MHQSVQYGRQAARWSVGGVRGVGVLEYSGLVSDALAPIGLGIKESTRAEKFMGVYFIYQSFAFL